jgi:hypothetical protein
LVKQVISLLMHTWAWWRAKSNLSRIVLQNK